MYSRSVDLHSCVYIFDITLYYMYWSDTSLPSYMYIFAKVPVLGVSNIQSGQSDSAGCPTFGIVFHQLGITVFIIFILGGTSSDIRWEI